ncbi:MAG: zinc ABC transporter substrate-binding protein [Rikenellaceae bacterium]
MRKIIILLLVSLVMGCGTSSKSNDPRPSVSVSIAPLGYLVEQLADSLLRVEVLVPLTTSPESYDPSARQIRDLANSDLYFSVGLIDFEKSLASRIESVAPNTKYINLSDGIEIMEGECSHDHLYGQHSHGIDPHIWLSPLNMIRMAESVCKGLSQQYPQMSEQLYKNLSMLRGRIIEFDMLMRKAVTQSNTHAFAIVHPSLSYFARDYRLTQLPVEIEGKEPSAKQIAQLIDQMRSLEIKKIFYARQDSDAAARTLAQELNIELVEYDPLNPQWLENLYHIKSLICN